MDTQPGIAVSAPDLAWIAALKAEGKYAAAAETLGRLYTNAPASQRYLLLCEWEELAFALRPAAVTTPHPSVLGVVPALSELLQSGHLSQAERAMLMARLARQQSWPDPSVHIPLAHEALPLARKSGDLETLIYALFCLHTTLDSPRFMAQRLQLSAELTSLAMQQPSQLLRAMAHWRAVTDALLTADSAGFDFHLEQLTHAAESTGDRFWLTAARIVSATRELIRGSYDQAEALLPQILETAGNSMTGMSMPAVTSVGLLARYQRGRGSMEGLSRMFQGVRSEHVAFRVGMAYYLATSGRPTEAAAEIGPVVLEDLPDDAGLVPSLCMAAEIAAHYFKDVETARSAYALLLPFDGLMSVSGECMGCWGPVSLYLGMTAQFLGDPAAAGHLEDARKTAAGLRARPWLGRANLLLGLERRNERPDEAAALLSEALNIAERLGLPSLAAEARAALRPEAPRAQAQSRTTLTAREREILGLVARGLTSAEAAAQLVLSPRTVEKHLEHAYAKIGARNRAEGISWAIVNGLTEDA